MWQFNKKSSWIARTSGSCLARAVQTQILRVRQHGAFYTNHAAVCRGFTSYYYIQVAWQSEPDVECPRGCHMALPA